MEDKMNNKPYNHVYMGKHAYRLAKEEIELITRSRSVKYKGVTLLLINLPFQIKK